VTIGGRRRPPLARGDAAHPTRVPAWALAPWLAEPVLNLAGHGQCDVMMTSADPFIIFCFIYNSENDVFYIKLFRKMNPACL
jgi:hypothetical protein